MDVSLRIVEAQIDRAESPYAAAPEQIRQDLNAETVRIADRNDVAVGSLPVVLARHAVGIEDGDLVAEMTQILVN